jgi:cellulose synthase/poly-beta-1,6-N-acetylglucosamine synthase-like glycosyltransferase
MVQTRWEHLNKNFSLLTHFQAFLLDAHFSIEQLGRNNAGYFINFSGTGGVWRKKTIIEAGGWKADTLTEDFDLSYRAQLKGWKFLYLENVGVPAELPPVMSALKKQQYRWIKGNAETGLKNLKQVLASKIPLPAKIHAFFHLMVGMVFICAFIASFLSIPLLLLKPHVPELKHWFYYASFSLLSLICLGVFHYVSTVHSGFNKNVTTSKYFIKTFPLYLSFSMGISLNNALAVMEAFFRVKTPFVRTPKFNVTEGGAISTYVKKSQNTNPIFIIELLLTVYFLGGASLAFYFNDFTMFPYHLMLAFGFGMMCYFYLRERFAFS